MTHNKKYLFPNGEIFIFAQKLLKQNGTDF